MNNLAEPAPRVEKASASNAPKVDAATTEDAQEVEPATAKKAMIVEPAVPFDTKRDSIVSDKSGGDQNLSVNGLRKTGVDFESYAAVLTGAPKKNFLKKILPMLYDERDFVSFGEVKRFVVVKGDCCFVFLEEGGIQPLYAIPLSDFNAFQEDPKNPDKGSVTISPLSASASKNSLTTVLLKHSNGKQGHQFTFDTSKDRSAAKRFLNLLNGKSTFPAVSVLSGNAAKKQVA